MWLVSKTVTDKLRAWLLSQSVDGIPSSNSAVFDELQSHDLIQPTPEGKAIWNATIVDGSWRQNFTLLKMQPSLIWPQGDQPASFVGQVLLGPAPQTLPLSSEAEKPEEPSDVIEALLTLLAPVSEATPDTSAEGTTNEPRSRQTSANLGPVFLDWLKTRIANKMTEC
ncbi:TraI domain-containing protein [Pseudomonas brenneri]|uniref:TraI domain-containing protein n=1 Tax=Pseudomonas brenneri TaxID=129817 RepID=UPI003571550F